MVFVIGENGVNIDPGFHKGVADLVHDVKICSSAAYQRVGTSAAIEGIDGRVSSKRVVEGISCGVAACDKLQVFDMLGKGVGIYEVADNEIRAFGVVFDDFVVNSIQDVSVIPSAPDECVDSGTAIQGIGHRIAYESIGERITHAVDDGSRENENFRISGQCVAGDTRNDGICAC